MKIFSPSMHFSLTRLGPRVLAFVLTCFAGTAGFAQRGGLRTYLNDVRDLRAAGQNELALRALEDLIVMAPQAAAVYYERATLRLQLKDVAGARADVDKVLALDPKWLEARTFRGRLRLDAGDYEGALEDLDKNGGPETVESWGQAMIGLGRYEAALPEYERLMSGSYGPYTNARYPRALCLLALDRVDEAVDWFEADVGDGGTVEARIQLVLGYAMQGRFDAAEKLVNEWLATAAQPAPEIDYERFTWEQLREHQDWARHGRGVICFAQNNFSGAAKAFDEVAPGSAPHDHARLLRHVALLRAKKTDAALKSRGDLQDPWAQMLAKFLRDELTEKEIFRLASEDTNTAERRRKETEAAFYAGEKRLSAGDEIVARLLFEKAVALRKADSAEYALAKIALKTL